MKKLVSFLLLVFLTGCGGNQSGGGGSTLAPPPQDFPPPPVTPVPEETEGVGFTLKELLIIRMWTQDIRQSHPIRTTSDHQKAILAGAQLDIALRKSGTLHWQNLTHKQIAWVIEVFLDKNLDPK